MSKFEELCKAREEAIRQFFAYRAESWAFALQLKASLVSYLECHTENTCFVSKQEPTEPKLIQLAMQFTHELSWEFGIVIGLHESAPAPAHGYYLQFAIKRRGPSFEIKLLKIDVQNKVTAEQAFSVARDNPDFQILNDHIFERIKGYFEPDSDKWLAEPVQGTAGFLRELARA
jgi:hypothetical protein